MSLSHHITLSSHHMITCLALQSLLDWSVPVSRYLSGKYHTLFITWSFSIVLYYPLSHTMSYVLNWRPITGLMGHRLSLISKPSIRPISRLTGSICDWSITNCIVPLRGYINHMHCISKHLSWMTHRWHHCHNCTVPHNIMDFMYKYLACVPPRYKLLLSSLLPSTLCTKATPLR